MATTTIPSPPAARSRWGRGVIPALPAVPFFAYVAVFLLLPTVIVVVGAFRDADGAFTFANVKYLGSSTVLRAFGWSIGLSALTALIGAVIGALLAYVLVTGSRDGALRRVVTAACSVLAQFGGVMLAFAFIATLGRTGMVTRILKDSLGITVDGNFLYGFNGLLLVYAYFQIPLMVIVFLPALDGIRPQWREATETLGGSTWTYWRHVAGPILGPAFISSTLLLFANSFSAYATAAALISQQNPLVPLQIRGALISEVNLGQANFAKVLALGMVLVVAVIMVIYGWLQKRNSRWLG